MPGLKTIKAAVAHLHLHLRLRLQVPSQTMMTILNPMTVETLRASVK